MRKPPRQVIRQEGKVKESEAAFSQMDVCLMASPLSSFLYINFCILSISLSFRCGLFALSLLDVICIFGGRMILYTLSFNFFPQKKKKKKKKKRFLDPE